MSNAPHLKVNSSHAHHLLGILSGNPPDGTVYHSVSRGQPESFFNLDLPVKYAPYPELHGPNGRHKLSTNHAQTKPSQRRRSTVSHTDTTCSTLNTRVSSLSTRLKKQQSYDLNSCYHKNTVYNYSFLYTVCRIPLVNIIILNYSHRHFLPVPRLTQTAAVPLLL